MPTTAGQNQSASETINILYVVLHGLISLVDSGKNGFKAYILDMGDEHEYLYGNWLVEDTIPLRSKGQAPLRAALQGVSAGKAKLDTKFNLVVAIKNLPGDNDPSLRAVIDLPRPKTIHHFISGSIASYAITGSTSAIGMIVDEPGQVSGVRVLEYEFEEQGKVILVPDLGTPLWSCPQLASVKDRNIAVLHVYNEPGDPLPNARAHSIAEFNQSAAFLGVQIALAKAAQMLLPAQGQISIPGLLPGETAALDQRKTRVINMVRDDRTKTPAIDDPGGGGTGGQICSAVNGLVS